MSNIKTIVKNGASGGVKSEQVLPVGKGVKGKSVRIKLAPDELLQLVDEETGLGPERIRIERVGNDLQLSFPEGGVDAPDVIVESYYSDSIGVAQQGRLVGQTSAGRLVSYTDELVQATSIAGPAQVSQVLGSQPINFVSATSIGVSSSGTPLVAMSPAVVAGAMIVGGGVVDRIVRDLDSDSGRESDKAQVAALSRIDKWAADSSNPANAPTVQDYVNAGVTGVTAANLGAVNNAVAAASAGQADSTAEIQALAAPAIEAAAALATALSRIDNWAADSSNPANAPTVQDYVNAGVTGVTTANLSAVNNAVAAAAAGQADTTAEIQALVAHAIITADIVGYITAGPVLPSHELSVKIFDANGNVLQEGIKVDAKTGGYRAQLVGYVGAFVVVVDDAGAGKDYMDEAIRDGKDLTATLLAAAVIPAGGGEIHVNLNVLTTAAAIQAGIPAGGPGKQVVLADGVLAANKAVGQAFDLANILTDTVVTTVDADGQDVVAPNAYGLVLAALSGADKVDSMSATIDALVKSVKTTGQLAVLDAAGQGLVLAGASEARLKTDQIKTLIEKMAPQAAAVVAQLGGDLNSVDPAKLTAPVVALLSTEQLGSLTDAQAQSVGLAGGLGGLMPEQIGSLTDATIDSVPPAVIDNMSADQVKDLKNEQLGALTSEQAAAIAVAGGFAKLSAEQLAVLSGAAIDSLPPELISKLTADQVKDLETEQLSALTSEQAAAIAAAGGFALLSQQQVLALSSGAIDSVPASVMAGLNAAQVASMTAEQLAALTPEQAAAIAAAGGFNNLSNAQLLGLPPAILAVVPASVVDNLTGAEVASLSQEQLAALTPAQAQAIGVAGGFGGLSNPQIQANPNIMAVVKSLALGKIDNWAEDNSNPANAPTLQDYVNAGVIGVTAANLDAV